MLAATVCLWQAIKCRLNAGQQTEHVSTATSSSASALVSKAAPASTASQAAQSSEIQDAPRAAEEIIFLTCRLCL